MKTIRENQYSTVEYDEVNALLIHTWLLASENMLDEDFIDEVFFWRDFVIANAIKYHILDTRNFRFTVVPKIQDKMAVEAVKPAVESGLQKMATILPEENLFAQVSVEQSLEENQQQGGLTSQYFGTIEEAKAWLLG